MTPGIYPNMPAAVGFQSYRGEDGPIENIEQWAADRGQQMVEYEVIERFVNFPACKIQETVRRGFMPEQFFNCLTFCDIGGRSVVYKQIGTRAPRV